tara:strand:+ start:703 stop:1059 length:357 start_codon:yes stop_codon:yes gene_type:complete
LKNILLLSSFLIIGITIPNCVHNYEPVINSISADPNPVSPGGLVNLVCKASDDDDSSLLKTESLSYSWYAAVGNIISENSDNIAIWTAPQETGKYSVSCSVSDKHNGLDIGTIEILVQ